MVRGKAANESRLTQDALVHAMLQCQYLWFVGISCDPRVDWHFNPLYV